MPSKAKRVASRQASLSRRKRRGGRTTAQNFQAAPAQPAEVGASAAATQTASRPSRQTAAPAVSASPAAATTAAAARPTQRSRRRSTNADNPTVYRYLGKELRQIGVITALMAVALVGLTFVLG